MSTPELEHEDEVEASRAPLMAHLEELRDRLIAERGERFVLSTIHDFFRRHGISFKKRQGMRASKSARM